ncbi:hypothetical protein CC85DRAFT_283970 [Cutaneotrichosporon oleaginosum]|uniref:Uncharacterized protein n=1 Tax=Cutaneotrichosporon oleaginosum TaxID=879819 RepID=A0A0J0XS82_9TREE|nr:uncharacterized protein CC85DRAFT_283970 [Cutaneotrichosporon oleaginosum]KLT43925.1 hypothetical protein CC85DRAFT_283970 [Cutaneotrichosporon oleaginosum]TXT04128.1 hypothetical protein COLE_07825 [Cutaneotrichosporon oleaginosum]
MLILALAAAALAASAIAQPEDGHDGQDGQDGAGRVGLQKRGWGWNRARSAHTPLHLQPPDRAPLCAIDNGSAVKARAWGRNGVRAAGPRPTPCLTSNRYPVINVRQTIGSTTSSPRPTSTSSPRPSSSSARPSSSSAPPSSSSSSSSAPPSSSSSPTPSPTPTTTEEPPTTTTESSKTSTLDTTTSETSTSSSSRTTPSQSPSSSAPPAAPTTVPIGAIIGAAIGGAVVVGALAALLIVRLKKRSRRRPRDSHLFMDPDFPIALDPYYPVPGTHSPAPSNLARNPSTGSMTGLTNRRSGYEGYDNVEYVYAGPDGYYDPATGKSAAPPQRGPSYVQRVPARQPSLSQGQYAAYAGPGACIPESERYDYDGHSHVQHAQYSQPQGYPAPGGYPPQANYHTQAPMQPQTTGGYPQAGYYAAEYAPAPVSNAYPASPARGPMRAPSVSTSSPVIMAAAPAPAPPHVSPDMVTHEEDAGVVLPTTLPPMYRAEWAPGGTKPAKG